MFSTSCMMSRDRSMTCWPAAVIPSRLLPLRVNNCNPSSSSSNLSCLLTPGWDVNNLSAAAVMFNPLSAIASRYLSCCSFILKLVVLTSSYVTTQVCDRFRRIYNTWLYRQKMPDLLMVCVVEYGDYLRKSVDEVILITWNCT